MNMAILDHLSIGIMIFDQNLKNIYSNKAIDELVKKNKMSKEKLERLYEGYHFSIADLEVATSNLMSILSSSVFKIEGKFLDYKNRKVIFLEIGEMTKDEILLQTLKEEEIKREKLINILDNLEDPVFYQDENLKYCYVNKSYEKFLGKTSQEILGKSDLELYPEGVAVHCRSNSMAALKNGNSSDEEFINGRLFRIFKGQVSIDNHEKGIFAVLKDITNIREKEEIYKRKMFKDSLTGLYNRNFYEEELRKIYSSATIQNKLISMILIDLDNLKNINDNYGHLTGDKVLKSVAGAIRKNLRKEDYEIRIGGDEFAVIVIDRIETVEKIAEKIAENVKSIEIDGIKPSISIGISQQKYNTNKSIDELFIEADKALYKSKNEGKGTMNYFSKMVTPCRGIIF